MPPPENAPSTPGPQRPKAPETFEVELIATEQLAPKVRGLRFARVDRTALAFEPGQWLNLVLPTVEAAEAGVRRAYSIASPPNDSPEFELAVTHVIGGPGSGYLFSLAPGKVLRAIGPQGFFSRAPSDRSPALLVATGTGVTPLRSMMLAATRAAASGAPTTPLTLLLGVRHEEDLLYRAELEKLTREHPNIEVCFTLSRPAADWQGRTGYVQEHVIELYRALEKRSRDGAVAAGGSSGGAGTAVTEVGAAGDAGTGAPHLYVVGLERMVKAVRTLAKTDLALPRGHVHSERYD